MRKDRRIMGSSSHLSAMRRDLVLRFSSPNRHASKHARASGHPVIASAQPNERWLYCYSGRRVLRILKHVGDLSRSLR